MSESAVTVWVDCYVRAWESNDPTAIGDLFAEQALYYPAPDTEPGRDRDGIVAGGSSARTSREPGTSATRSWR